jgi:hypothetical protein
LRAQAYESRSQHENRARALKRLRQTIALEIRSDVDVDRFEPSAELLGILSTDRGTRVGSANPRFWPGAAALLDLFVALDCSVSATAAALGVSSARLSRVLTEDDRVRTAVNRLRAARKLRPLASG